MKLPGLAHSIITTWHEYAKPIIAAVALFVTLNNAVMAQWDNLPSMWELTISQDNRTLTKRLQHNHNRAIQREWQNNINQKLHKHNDKILRAKNLACQIHLRETGKECWDKNNN